MDLCTWARDRMDVSLRDELSADEEREFERHMAACSACAREWEPLRVAWLALDEVEVPVPRPELRSSVLSAVAAARAGEEGERVLRATVLKFLLPALVAALVTAVFVLGPETQCRSSLAVACCGVLWSGVYALAFAVAVGSQAGTPLRRLTVRGLAAGAAGLLLVRLCAFEGAERFRVPLLGGLTDAAGGSPLAAFGLGLLFAAPPLVAAILAAPVREARSHRKAILAEGGLYFALLGPAVALFGSESLAVGGLAALLLGAVVGSTVPLLLEVTFRQIFPGKTGEGSLP
ncbi:MAG: anti-sigma factor [Thermodesulfobacteriota bacterium]